MNFECEYIEKLAKLVSDNQLSEITLEDGDKAITIKKGAAVSAVVQASAPVAAVAAPAQATAVEAASAVQKSADTPKGTPITSPMVGAFYAAPSPGSEPYVKVGDVVKAGQVVCIVEAMKLMNEIESEVSGKVVQICVEDGQSVEYGQVLMYVE